MTRRRKSCKTAVIANAARNGPLATPPLLSLPMAEGFLYNAESDIPATAVAESAPDNLRGRSIGSPREKNSQQATPGFRKTALRKKKNEAKSTSFVENAVQEAVHNVERKENPALLDNQNQAAKPSLGVRKGHREPSSLTQYKGQIADPVANGETEAAAANNSDGKTEVERTRDENPTAMLKKDESTMETESNSCAVRSEDGACSGREEEKSVAVVHATSVETKDTCSECRKNFDNIRKCVNKKSLPESTGTVLVHDIKLCAEQQQNKSCRAGVGILSKKTGRSFYFYNCKNDDYPNGYELDKSDYEYEVNVNEFLDWFLAGKGEFPDLIRPRDPCKGIRPAMSHCFEKKKGHRYFHNVQKTPCHATMEKNGGDTYFLNYKGDSCPKATNKWIPSSYQTNADNFLAFFLGGETTAECPNFDDPQTPKTETALSRSPSGEPSS